LTIGPTWGFTIGLFGFILFCLGYFGFVLLTIRHLKKFWFYIAYLFVFIEISFILITFLKNPGMPKEIVSKKRHELENPDRNFEDNEACKQ